MRIANLRRSTRNLLFQRNIFLGLSFILALAFVPVSLLLFFKQERIVVVPPVVEKTFWVEKDNVSATYLEQFGHFLGQLLLGKSEQSASLQKEIVLRHTDPAFAGHLQKKLKEEEIRLRKQNASYVFYPERIEIDQKKLTVFLWGERSLFVEEKKISSSKEGYVLGFNCVGSRLLLNSLEKKEWERDS
ncbi:MAG: type IV conjugative transfer system protein TraE [Waddliaceae bacterium]